jgi:hypothetical protein
MSTRPRSAALLLSVLLTAGCATGRHAEPGERVETASVSTDERVPLTGAPGPSDVIVDDTRDDAILAAQRLVANGGRSSHLAWSGLESWYSGGCGMRPFQLAGTGHALSPMAEGGVYRSFDPLYRRPSLVMVGLSIGEGLESLFVGSCGSRGLVEASSTRLSGIAAELTGRDTSLLFTTRRATSMTKGSASGGLVGAVVEQFVGSSGGGGGGGSAPRTAVPRSAAPAKATGH